MRHRGRTQTVSFRLGGKDLEDLERQAREFGLSLGEFSRSALGRYLKNEESRAILEAVEGLALHHQRLAESLTERIAAAEAQLSALRHDFNRAIAQESS